MGLSTLLDSPIALTIDNLPDYSGDTKLFSVYESIQNAVRILQQRRLPAQKLEAVTATRFSNSALSSRIYMRAAEDMTAGTWCQQSLGLAASCTALEWLGNGNQGVDYRMPMLLLRDVLAGNTAELCTSGIVFVAAVLIPGAIYTLKVQNLTEVNYMYAQNQRRYNNFSVLGYALSDHHLLLKKLH